eukprot:1020502-Rhodomonas_salina.2
MRGAEHRHHYKVVVCLQRAVLRRPVLQRHSQLNIAHRTAKAQDDGVQATTPGDLQQTRTVPPCAMSVPGIAYRARTGQCRISPSSLSFFPATVRPVAS